MGCPGCLAGSSRNPVNTRDVDKIDNWECLEHRCLRPVLTASAAARRELQEASNEGFDKDTTGRGWCDMGNIYFLEQESQQFSLIKPQTAGGLRARRLDSDLVT